MSHILLLPWEILARLCPLECNIHHQTDDHYTLEIVNGIPIWNGERHFVYGFLTAEWQRGGFLFSHPGISGGSIFIEAHELCFMTLKHAIFVQYT